MKNYGVVLFDDRTSRTQIMEHNVSPQQISEAVARYRAYRLAAFMFPHRGLHEHPNAEDCADCVEIIAIITRKARKPEVTNG